MLKIQLIDHLNQQILYQGKAEIEYTNQGVRYRFANERFSFSWTAYKDTLIIDSISEVHVHLVLRSYKRTKGWIRTEFGEIDVSCFTHHYEMQDQRIEIQYELDMEKQSQRFEFVLEIKEAEYAVH